MKRASLLLAAFVCLLLFGASASALAEQHKPCDAPPKGVLRYIEEKSEEYQQYGDSVLLRDYIRLEIPDKAQGIALVCETGTGYPWLAFFEDSAGEMVYKWESPFLIPNLPNMYFVRHTEKEYSDTLGFTIIGDRKQVGIHYINGSLRTSEWLDADESEQTARIENDALVYRIGQQAIGSVPLLTIDECFSDIVNFDYLPKTLEAAQQLASIARTAAERLYPGRTMYSYDLFIGGYKAEAAYLKVENGCLLLRTANLDSVRGNTFNDFIPLPLSPEYAALSEQEAVNKLMKMELHADSLDFFSKNIIDRSRITIPGDVLQCDVQPNQLIVLAEDNGERRIWVVEANDNDYTSVRTEPLPKDIYLDTFHGSFDEISLEWNQQSMQCSFYRDAFGAWQLDWVMGSENDYRVLPYGISRINADVDELCYGFFPCRALMVMDLSLLPGSFEEAVSLLDCSTIAAVNNPNPEDRLHLRTEPSKGAPSLGKFYNGTPLTVLERKNGWTRIAIGDGRFTGWMMDKYLAYGKACNQVKAVFPSLLAKESGAPVYSSCDKQSSDMVGNAEKTGFTIIGVYENSQYVLMLDNGQIGYAEQSDFWDGNG